MGWTGIHLFEFTIRGVRYTGSDLCGAPVDIALLDFRFRRNARLRYVYDMICCWEHALRVEERLPAVAGKRYPRCTGGAGACPPEDCGGPDGYHARRDEAVGVDAMDDLVLLADFVERVMIENDCSWADDDETRLSRRDGGATLGIPRPISGREVFAGGRQQMFPLWRPSATHVSADHVSWRRSADSESAAKAPMMSPCRVPLCRARARLVPYHHAAHRAGTVCQGSRPS